MSPLATYLVETIVTLVGVVALAVLILYGGRRLGLGRPTGPLELLGRLPLDTRRAVYLVRAGKTVYVVGASEGGLTRLGELSAEGFPSERSSPPTALGEGLVGGTGFQAILAQVKTRAMGKKE